MNRREITTLLMALCALFLLHITAMANHWYVRFPGFDIPMHFLGGLCVAMSIQYLMNVFFHTKSSFGYVMFLTFFATICWELFEAHYNIAGHPVGTLKYYVDSVKDVVVGCLGGAIVTKNRVLLFKIKFSRGK